MNTMAFTTTDPFFNVPRTQAATSEGTVQLPILYHSTRNISAFFMVDEAALRASLKAAGAEQLQPACVWRGKALVAVASYEYLDTSIGPYNEIGIAVPVTPPGVKPRLGHWLQTLSDVDSPTRELGYFVLHLPVNTPAACAAGKDIWGFPKFVTPIDYGRYDASVDIVLFDPAAPRARAQAIMTLSGRVGRSIPGPSLSPLLYSLKQGKWLKTAVNVRGGGRIHAGSGLRLRVGTSQHPMAQTLRALGLADAQPWFVMDTDTFQSRLNDGRALA